MLDSHLIAKTRPVACEENTVRLGKIRITVLSPRLFRAEEDDTLTFCDGATQSVWFRDASPVPFRTEKHGKSTFIITGETTLVISGSLEKSYVLLDGKRIRLDNSGNLLGTYRTLDRCEGETYISDKGEKHRIKLENGVVSKSGVAVFDDSSSLLLSGDGRVISREPPEKDIYVFAFGHDYRRALCALYKICGNVPVIPRFALGNWWSRYHAYTEKEYLHVIDRLDKENIPLTVATIDMDWHWSTPNLDENKHITEQGKNDDFHGRASGWTGYSWNTALFPDYRRFLKEIRSRKLKITLNLHPAMGVRYFEDMYAEMAEAVGINPETEEQVKFDFTSDRFINAYFKILHKPYEHDGVDFWWIDWQQGKRSALSGLDPLWALNHYHTLDIAKEHEALILSRYCGIGSHRYPLGFSGDTVVSWKSLDFVPYFTVNAANAGYTWWSHDIGGHFAGIKDDELYTRYVQFGVFSPINRLHCTSAEVATKEPSVYMNGTGMIAREFLRLRHRLIPYIYSAAVDTHENGRALMEPMYYGYPEENEAYLYRNEYFFGSQLIVLPITKKSDSDGLTKVNMWLPDGRWTDIFTGDEYNGGRTVSIVRWLDTIPVLAREGGILVLDGRPYTNSTDNPEKLNVAVFSGNGSYNLYEDSACGKAVTRFVSSSDNGAQTILFKSEGDNGVCPERTVCFEFRNISNGKVTVTADGFPFGFSFDDDGFVTVTLSKMKADTEYKISVIPEERDKASFRNGRFLYSLQRFSGDIDKKEELLRSLCALTDGQCRAIIEDDKALSANKKARLLESLNA